MQWTSHWGAFLVAATAVLWTGGASAQYSGEKGGPELTTAVGPPGDPRPICAVPTSESPLYADSPATKHLNPDLENDEEAEAWNADTKAWRERIRKLGRVKVGTVRCEPAKYNARLGRLPVVIQWGPHIEPNVWDPWIDVSPAEFSAMSGAAVEGTLTAEVGLARLEHDRRDDLVYLEPRMERTGRAIAVRNRILREFHKAGARRGDFSPALGWILSVNLSADGRRALVVSSGESAARLHDTQTGKLLHRLAGPVWGLNPATLSADGRRALVANWLFDAETGKVLRKLTRTPSGEVSVSLSADGRWALGLTSNHDHSAYLWDTESGKHRVLCQGQNGPYGPIHRAILSDDGRRALVAHWNSTVTIWDVQSGTVRHSFKHSPPENCPTEIQGRVAMSADGAVAILPSGRGPAVLWSAARAVVLFTLEGSMLGCKVAISSDGTKALTGGRLKRNPSVPPFDQVGPQSADWNPDEAATLWDTRTGKAILKLHSPRGAMVDVALSGDGSVALTGGAGTGAILWDTRH